MYQLVICFKQVLSSPNIASLFVVVFFIYVSNMTCVHMHRFVSRTQMEVPCKEDRQYS